jgi:hypothetical protein
VSTQVYVRENEPSPPDLAAEERRVRARFREHDRKQSEDDEALGIVRATPFGKPFRVCWSLNEAMKAC